MNYNTRQLGNNGIHTPAAQYVLHMYLLLFSCFKHYLFPYSILSGKSIWVYWKTVDWILDETHMRVWNGSYTNEAAVKE